MVTAPAATLPLTFSLWSPTARSAYPSRLKSAFVRESPKPSLYPPASPAVPGIPALFWLNVFICVPGPGTAPYVTVTDPLSPTA